MICPACASPMIVVEYNKIEIDYCTACHGVWFDSGELELILENLPDNTGKNLLDIHDHPKTAIKEKPRRCPICGNKMKKTDIGYNVPLILDFCQKNNDGIFFDGGELSQLIKRVVPNPESLNHPVVKFLTEILKATN